MERSRFRRSTMWPSLRASMNSVSPCLSRCSPLARPRERNQRQAGICVERKSWPGSATMQSTKSASMMLRRVSPSPDERGGHGAVGEHKAGGSARREVVDEVLHPREVGVAGRRDAVSPTLVLAQAATAPATRPSIWSVKL